MGLTLDDVYSDGADVPHGGVTGVLPGVHQPRLLDEEEGDCDLPLLCDLTDAPRMEEYEIGSLLWYQKMNCGGSGLSFTRQVRFMVEPSSRKILGLPTIWV